MIFELVGQEFRDWTNVTFSKQTNVPDSCCLSDVAGCGAGVLGLDQSQAAMKIHTEGCLDIFTGIIQGNIGAVGGLGLGVGFLQLLGMLFALYLANTIKKEYETV